MGISPGELQKIKERQKRRRDDLDQYGKLSVMMQKFVMQDLDQLLKLFAEANN